MFELLCICSVFHMYCLWLLGTASVRCCGMCCAVAVCLCLKAAKDCAVYVYCVLFCAFIVEVC